MVVLQNNARQSQRASACVVAGYSIPASFVNATWRSTAKWEKGAAQLAIALIEREPRVTHYLQG